MKTFFLRFALLTGSLLLAVATSLAQNADVIFVNGKVVTVNEDFTIAEAFAIEGDRIIAVGSNQEVIEAAGPARTINLQGATVLPGVIDSHVHAVGASMYEFDHEVPDMESIADVLRYIESRAAVLKEGDWIQLQQVFITRLLERRFPSREEMDKAAPKNPVWFRTGPDAALNSLALKYYGIDRDYQVPEGSQMRIERNASGEPTGIIRTAGGLSGKPSGRSPTKEERLSRLRELLADYNKVGLTSVSARNAGASNIDLYSELKDRGELTCRVFLYRGVNARQELSEIQKDIHEASQHPLHRYDNMLWLRGVKIFLDGGMLTGSAYMKEPWGLSESYGINDPEYRGIRYVEPDQLYRIARFALEHDLQITAHSVGDGAVETLVDAYSRIAEDDFPVRDLRPCVTHCNFMTPDAIAKMAKHGIVADLQPAWLYLDGGTLKHHFGNERLTWFQPYHALFEQGVIVGGGSDHMQKIGSLRSVNPYNPFLGMWTTLTRQPRREEAALHPEQRITREQAIRLYTINNAFLSFEEFEKGSIEPGKLADFILLDRDILTCPVDEVREIQVKQTWLGGKQVWGAE